METYILSSAICFCFYILGAYATTDILRLLKGSSVSVNAPDCYCPICNHKILLRDQLPIISYLLNHGACRNCKSKIPFSDLFLEIFLFLTLSLSSVLLRFSLTAYLLCILIYECTKLFFILRFGKRETAFLKNFAVSLFNNLLLFGFIGILFALFHFI